MADDPRNDLHQVMQKLGKTPDDTAHDQQLIRQIRFLQGHVKDGSNLEERIAQAQQAVADSAKDMKAKIQELQNSHAQTVQVLNNLGERSRRAHESAQSLEKLSAACPEIFQRLTPKP